MDDLTNDELNLNNALSVSDDFAQRMFNIKLAALRAQNPFLEIIPFPNEVLSYQLTAGIALDIDIPSGTKMIRFKGTGVYYVSRNGNAEIPNDVTGARTGSLMNPEYAYFWVEEVRSISVISASNEIVTVAIFRQL